ncbi:MFS transporter [Streptomyces atratus]|uniref:MFS transporter n=1 Tax=Streptomyces atratus TaxID=1893 RepID=UPI0022576547|nr:MFS transporter [Streptomyces atratus]MCX5340806.1 MFS transporter [Streptomyces atratus]
MPSYSPTPEDGSRDATDTSTGPAAPSPHDPSAAPRAARARPAGPVPTSAPPPERADPIDPNPSPALRAAAPAADVLPDDPAPGRPRGYRAVFAVREFRAVFAAHLLSLLGVVVSELALTVLVYDLTGSPLLSALTFALGFLPYLVGGTLFAGVADRYPARRVLVTCDLICAGCVAVMVLPGTPVGGLLALRCLVASVSPVFTGTRMAALTDILGEGDLYVLGRSLLRIVSQSALLTGFGVGGVLLAALSARGAITITVGTFLCSAALLRLGTRDRPARTGGDRGGALLKESLAGARIVLADRRIRALMLLFWVPALFVVAPEALAAPYADEIGLGPAALGLLMCAMPVGHIAAELYAGAVLTPRVRSRIVLPVAAAGLLPLGLYGFRPGLPLTLAALALAGVGAAYIIGLDQWFVDALPEELRGRAMTLLTAGLMTLQGIGMALAGLAAEFVPVHLVVAGSGVIGTVCTLLLVREVKATAPAGGPRTEVRDGADQHMTSG